MSADLLPPPATVARLSGRALAAVEATLGAVVGAILLSLLAIVGTAVVLRYGVGTGFVGTEEVALWLFVALVFLGLPLIGGSAVSMRLDLLAGRLPPPGRAATRLVADAVTVHALLVLLSGGLVVIERLGGTSVALGLPEWLRFGAIPVGAVLAFATLLLRAAAEERLRTVLVAAALGAGLLSVSHAGLLWPVSTPSLFAGVAVLGFLLAGAPLPFALLSALSLALPLGSLLPEPAIVQTTVSGMAKFLLLAVPFFLLASSLMMAGGLAGRLVRFAAALVGHRRGGLAQTTVLTNVLLSGVSGSSIADAAFGAKVLAPGLVGAGYTPARAAAIVAAASVLGNVIPPSVAFLILAVATDLSVGALFTGGLVAGLVLAAALGLALHATGAVEAGGRTRATAAERRAALRAAVPVFGLALIVLLGIRFGVMTPTEAAAVAALYALGFALLRRSGAVWEGVIGAARETAGVGLLIGTASPVVFLLAVDGVPETVAVGFAGLGIVGVLVGANLVLLAAGCILDIGAGILLLAPLLLPAAVAAGLDPVAFGVLLVVNLMIGGLTPPVGILVYVVSGLMRLPAGAVFRAVLPLLGTLAAALAAMSAAVGLAAL